MTQAPPLRIVFAGTPEFAAIHLCALIDSPHEIVAVYTQPDRPAGRGRKLTPSAVKQLALEADVPVHQPQSLKSAEEQKKLASLEADVMVVVAYGLLLPQAILDTPRFGCLNVHGSILPKWRGAAPIQRAIEAGDAISGVTIMQMDAGLDTGDMLEVAECTLDAKETTLTLHDKLASLGPTALLKVLNNLSNDSLQATKQDDASASYAKKILKEEAQINWHEDAEVIERKIRAFNPFPVCFFFLDDQKRVKVYEASVLKKENTEAGKIYQCTNDGLLIGCGRNALLIKTLQLPGKKAMPIHDVLNGASELFRVGDQLSTEAR